MGDVVQPVRRHPRLLLFALLAFVAHTILALSHTHVPGGLHQDKVASGDICPDKQGPCPAPTPAGHDTDCPLCAAIHAASTLIPPAGPADLIFFSCERTQLTIFAWAARPTPRAFRFRARAPPEQAS